jgi:hypothetical protein
LDRVPDLVIAPVSAALSGSSSSPMQMRRNGSASMDVDAGGEEDEVSVGRTTMLPICSQDVRNWDGMKIFRRMLLLESATT